MSEQAAAVLAVALCIAMGAAPLSREWQPNVQWFCEAVHGKKQGPTVMLLHIFVQQACSQLAWRPGSLT